MEKYINEIENIWAERNKLDKNSSEFITSRAIIDEVITALDKGLVRVCVKNNNIWHVNEWAKKAILLYFKFTGSVVMHNGHGLCYDKVQPKFDHSKDDDHFIELGIYLLYKNWVRLPF